MSFGQGFPAVAPPTVGTPLTARGAEELQRYQRKLLQDMQQQAKTQQLRGTPLGALAGTPMAMGQLGLGFFPTQSASRAQPMPSPEDYAARHLRRGKWTSDEEKYAQMLIDCFKDGTLQDAENGTTLRCYLSRKLNCAPMRISKKYAGLSIGKLIYASKAAKVKGEDRDVGGEKPAGTANQPNESDEAEKSIGVDSKPENGGGSGTGGAEGGKDTATDETSRSEKLARLEKQFHDAVRREAVVLKNVKDASAIRWNHVMNPLLGTGLYGTPNAAQQAFSGAALLASGKQMVAKLGQPRMQQNDKATVSPPAGGPKPVSAAEEKTVARAPNSCNTEGKKQQGDKSSARSGSLDNVLDNVIKAIEDVPSDTISWEQVPVDCTSSTTTRPNGTTSAIVGVSMSAEDNGVLAGPIQDLSSRMMEIASELTVEVPEGSGRLTRDHSPMPAGSGASPQVNEVGVPVLRALQEDVRFGKGYTTDAEKALSKAAADAPDLRTLPSDPLFAKEFADLLRSHPRHKRLSEDLDSTAANLSEENLRQHQRLHKEPSPRKLEQTGAVLRKSARLCRKAAESAVQGGGGGSPFRSAAQLAEKESRGRLPPKSASSTSIDSSWSGDTSDSDQKFRQTSRKRSRYQLDGGSSECSDKSETFGTPLPCSVKQESLDPALLGRVGEQSKRPLRDWKTRDSSRRAKEPISFSSVFDTLSFPEFQTEEVDLLWRNDRATGAEKDTSGMKSDDNLTTDDLGSFGDNDNDSTFSFSLFAN